MHCLVTDRMIHTARHCPVNLYDTKHKWKMTCLIRLENTCPNVLGPIQKRKWNMASLIKSASTCPCFSFFGKNMRNKRIVGLSLLVRLIIYFYIINYF